MKINWKNILPHFIAVVTFIILSCVYFNPQLQGEKLIMGDIVQHEAMVKEIKDYREATGEETLWTNSMFGGMPAYQISAPPKNNLSKYLEQIGQLFFKRPIGYFIGGMIFFYIALTLLGVNSWLSLIGAIAFVFTTNNLVLLEAGHITKIRVIMSSILIIAGTMMAYRKKLLLGAGTFVSGMAISLYSNHIQMTYYLGILLGIYVIFEFVGHIKNNDIKSFLKSSGVLLLCLVIALGTSASKILTTQEYAEDTMRGKPIIESDNAQASSSSETEGLQWDYAMMWSNGFVDLFSSYIPGFAGGSSAEPISENSATAKALRGRANVDRAPLYWGGILKAGGTGTSGPIYFGAVMFFLFIFGLLVVRGPVKWWLLVAVLLTFLLSLGKNLEWFNKLFFEYVPLYNKFRTPNSVLSVTAILIPILAMLGLKEVFDQKDKSIFLKPLYISAGILAGSCVLFALLGPSLFDFNAPGDARYGQMGYSVEAIIKDRKSLLVNDSLRSLLFILLAAGLLWLWVKNKIQNLGLMISGIALLILVDLWGVGKRYLNSDDFVPASNMNRLHPMRPVDEAILKDTDLYFRVHDLTTDPFNSASASYYHKTIGGYHPAKLQRYADIIDKYLSQGNFKVLNMLNAKYFIITDDQGQPTFQINMDAMGNAWFVENIIQLNTQKEELNGIAGLNPEETALVYGPEFSSYFEGWNISKPETARIQLTSYAPNKLVYSSTGTGDKFAVFSEIWYGPNKGWQAYIDGEPVDHVRVNYLLRGLKVPPGSHEIIFEFDPKTYKIGETISLICSILLFGYLGFLIYKSTSKKKEA